MSEELIYVYPGHEIHLAGSTNGAKEVKLQVNHRTLIENPGNDSVDYLISDVTAASLISVTGGTGGPFCEFVAAAKLLRVKTGVATGQDTLKVSFKNAQNQEFKLEIKIFVHERLDDWWLGNNSLSVPQDNRVFHCQATVYGHFDAPGPNAVGTIADITGHGFIQFSSGGVFCKVDPDNRGRIQGLVPGATQVQASFNGKNETLPIEVTNFYGDPISARLPNSIISFNHVLKRVPVFSPGYTKSKDSYTSGSGPADRFNILFLAEGFTAQEEKVVDMAIDWMIQKLFSGDMHQPFKMCSGNFNVWKGFIPSRETGLNTAYDIKITAPVNKSGMPQMIDSYYGLYKPRRPGDVLYTENDTMRSGDSRRYPPELNWSKCIGRHIASLADNSGIRGQIWYNDLPPSRTGDDFLKDFGLVVVLCNTLEGSKERAHHAGNFIVLPLPRHLPGGGFAVDRGTSSFQWKIRQIFLEIHIHFSMMLFLDLFRNIEETSFILSHELMHSFDLGDEYEDPVKDFKGASGFSNNVAFEEIKLQNDDPLRIKKDAIKWKEQDRIEKCERVMGIDSLTTGGGKWRVTVTMATQNIRRWEPDKKAGTKICLREFRVRSQWDFRAVGNLDFQVKHFNIFPAYAPVTGGVLLEDPLVVLREIEIVQLIGNNKMQLDIPENQLPNEVFFATNKLEALRKLFTANGYVNGVLYLPKKSKTTPATVEKLIRKEVLSFFDTQKVPLDHFGTFNADTTAEYPPTFLVPVKGKFLGNRFPYKVIGLYEGAAHAQTHAYRPAGNCRMRMIYLIDTKLIPEFCFVCQYNTLSILNPAMLEELEKMYPDF
jgi:hypothetical protein